MTVVENEAIDVQLDEVTGSPAQVNEFRLLTELGEGAYGQVYLCEKTIVREDGTECMEKYAMKIINKSLLRRKREFRRRKGTTETCDAFHKVQREIAIMKKLSHPNLTKMYQVIDSEDHGKLFIVLEYVAQGQLMEWHPIKKVYTCPRSNSTFSMSVAQRCLMNVVHAVEYLHVNNICHRDIKPDNILVSSDGSFKLTDFGVSHMFDQTEGSTFQLNNTEGTYHFLAPECLVSGPYDPFKVDIWALGITVYAMLYGKIPFGSEFSTVEMNELVNAIQNDTLEFPKEQSEEKTEKEQAEEKAAQDLIARMLERNPTERITLQEIKKHEWYIESAFANEEREKELMEPVQVTNEEIEMAFTPTNNFVLMSKLKMKLSTRLARIRSSHTPIDGNSMGSMQRQIESQREKESQIILEGEEEEKEEEEKEEEEKEEEIKKTEGQDKEREKDTTNQQRRPSLLQETAHEEGTVETDKRKTQSMDKGTKKDKVQERDRQNEEEKEIKKLRDDHNSPGMFIKITKSMKGTSHTNCNIM